VERVLVAVGRRPSTRGLGLDAAGVTLGDAGFIETDDTMRTTGAGVWAVGDVTGRLQLTHAAARMGLIAADNALSRMGRVRPKRFDVTAVPAVTFTDPEVAHVGMTEAEAADHDGRVAVVPFDAFDRAITAGRTDGHLKLIAGPRRVLGNAGGGRILGATIVGPAAGELINEVALAIRTRLFAGRLAQTVHAYPTWSAAVQIAAAQLFFDVDGRGHRPARR
jgi:pyruvate/2-oxoglutarate dehydrogenase complex dihydrolipoamide dehydrogenase (E3) component